MADIISGAGNDNLNGGAGADYIYGGGGNDIINSGAGNDILDGGSGSDRLNGGSGADTLIYNLSDNLIGGATADIYTGGSGIDTLRIELTASQWASYNVQAQLASYVQFLSAVKMNPQGEVSNGSASDFNFTFGSATLKVQMTEKLDVYVNGTSIGDLNQPFIMGGLTAGNVVEDADETPSGTDAMTASGAIDFIDLNWADTHYATVAPLAGAIGTMTASVTNASTGDGQGQVTWQYALDDAASQYLAAGQTKVETFIVTITDSCGKSATQSVTVTVTGTNDAPTISAADASAAVTEDAASPTLSDSGTITFDDLDLSDAHSTSVAAAVGNTLGGVLTAVVDPLDPATGVGSGTVNWSYSVANSATQYLAQGQSATENFTVSIADGHGGTVDQLITVTVTGTNDGVTISSGTQAGTVTEDADLSASGAVVFNDVDLSDTHTAAFVAAAGQTALGVFALGSVSESAATEPGSVGWSYDLTNAAAQYLGADESVTEVYTVTVTDEAGASNTQDVTITIQGTNDGPDIHLVTTDTASASLTETNAGLSTSGTLTVTDADLSDSVGLSVTSLVASGTTADLGLTNAQLLAMLSIAPVSSSANPGSTNNATWSFNSGTHAFDYLAAGQSLVLTYTVHGDDGHAGTDDQTMTITINGTADGPVAAPPVYNGADPNDFDAAGPGAATSLVVPGSPAINGDNIIVGTNGIDTVDAKSGADFVYGYGGDDNLAGGSGTDSIYGGAGNDTIDGGQDTDTIYGGSGDDFIKGGSEIDTIYGGSGNDTIQGDAANDVIIGGFGADLLTGNAGNDTFRFLDIRDTGDTIVGFASGDKIDLSSIDADPSTANDTFGFAGNTSTLAAHSVNWFFNDNGTAANTADDFTVIQVDTDGNIGTAEMEIHLIGTISLVTGDFLP